MILMNILFFYDLEENLLNLFYCIKDLRLNAYR